METKIEAYEAIKPSAATMRQKVIDFIEEHGASTDEEISNGVPMHRSTVTPRRNELMHLGVIVDSGERRKTATGRKAIVWKLV